MNVVGMLFQIRFVANRVLPKPALPNTAATFDKLRFQMWLLDAANL